MDIERLRALENRLRDEAGQHEINALEADSVGATEAAVGQEWRSDLKRELADELATLIAELGQEVGAVYAHPVELEAARRNYARGLADGLLTVSVQPIPGFVPLYNSSATPTAAADSAAVRLIAAERRRQVEVEGFGPDRDDQYRYGDMADAAGCYALSPVARRRLLNDLWPWEMRWFKPGNRIRELVKAGALIVAEIERLQRADAARNQEGGRG